MVVMSAQQASIDHAVARRRGHAISAKLSLLTLEFPQGRCFLCSPKTCLNGSTLCRQLVVWALSLMSNVSLD